MFSFLKGTILSDSGNVALAFRFIATQVDLIIKNTPYKVVLFTPYMHKNDKDIPSLADFETSLFYSFCLDQDLSPHLYSRIKFFSILKASAEYKNPDPCDKSKQSFMEFKEDRYYPSEFGYQQISIQLAELIAQWVPCKRHTKLNLNSPMHFSGKSLAELTRQTSANKAMVLYPDFKKTVPNPLWQPADPPKKSDLVLDPLAPSASTPNSNPVPPPAISQKDPGSLVPPTIVTKSPTMNPSPSVKKPDSSNIPLKKAKLSGSGSATHAKKRRPRKRKLQSLFPMNNSFIPFSCPPGRPNYPQDAWRASSATFPSYAM